MAKKRPSVQKRQREQLKRQREIDKAAKSEQKRQRRQERAEAKLTMPDESDRASRDQDDDSRSVNE